jgi:hypothetical protein
MFAYVCDRVLEDRADEIHEQEVGHHVFGRPIDYNTADDNTVRVHASLLRKRIDQYFATEGSNEPVIIEIPRGNYAPRFLERPVKPAAASLVLQPEPAPISTVSVSPMIEPPLTVTVEPQPKWKFWLPTALTALTALFAGLSLFLFFNGRGTQTGLQKAPTARQFWSQLVFAGKPTDVVVGDASLSTFEEMTGHQITLSEYFDRSYLSKVDERAAAAKIDPAFASSLVLKRQSSYGDVSLLSKLEEMAHVLQSNTDVRFARDYSFRQLKADNVVLLGYRSSNPWIEPFENQLTLRWKFDPARGQYFVVDTTANDPQKYGMTAARDQPHEGYATLSFMPNLSNTGNVLIIAGTGGSAAGSALDFLTDEHSMQQLHALLVRDKKAPFPHFEALLKVGSRNVVPRDSSIVLSRVLKP